MEKDSTKGSLVNKLLEAQYYTVFKKFDLEGGDTLDFVKF